MDTARLRSFVDGNWDDSIIPSLVDYIRIPNKSPHFDPDWASHGYMDDAVELISAWCTSHAPRDMSIEVVRLPGRTPLLFMEVPGDERHTVLLYGHLDKQPEMTGWREDLGPWKPVISTDKLYGRGGADDGYAAFASLTAIRALQEQGIPHARCVVIIEACEESGSYDLPHYIEHLRARIGSPELVVCLDSGCGNYDQLWCTTSLRGIAAGTLCVDILDEGVHSGDASGVVPSSFRIVRQLLDRIEDADSGEVLGAVFHAPIPADRAAQAQHAADVLGGHLLERYPLVDGAWATASDAAELILNRTWRPALSVTGAGGLPAIAEAGNVLRPGTALKLSMRCPPTCSTTVATRRMKKVLEADPPYGARVSFTADQAGDGWNAPPVVDWLAASLDAASHAFFGREAVYMGEGGSIPFMGMLGEMFPGAQFLITGVLGPQSNAHGPNEFLHLPTGKRVTACVAKVLADHLQAVTLARAA